MTKINELVKASNCIEGGSKEAAIKVKTVLENISVSNGNVLRLGRSDIDSEEFLRSIRKLVAYAETCPDRKVELWYCESDCVRAANPNCPYKQFMVSSGDKICPYYIEEDK